jgi:hypothetical protein
VRVTIARTGEEVGSVEGEATQAGADRAEVREADRLQAVGADVPGSAGISRGRCRPISVGEPSSGDAAGGRGAGERLHRAGSTWQNPSIESFNGHLSRELLEMESFNSRFEAQRCCSSVTQAPGAKSSTNRMDGAHRLAT